MDDDWNTIAQHYAAQRGITLTERLGSGIHGIVFIGEDNLEGGKFAIKIHRGEAAFLRECAVYERLKEAEVLKIEGFNVPQLLRFDEDLKIIEMTVVRRPFVLDFAGAYLDSPPYFSDEIWAEWEAQKSDQFEDRWPKVQKVLAALEELDIHMIDVTPNNIAFLD